MAGRRGIPRHVQNRRNVSAIALALVTAFMAALAMNHDGIPTARVDVNDGGIWITNAAKKLVGHLNYDSRTLDGAFRTTASAFDIGQTGNVVTFSDLSQRSLTVVDVAGVRLGSALPLSAQATAVQGGDRVGVLDPESGQLWSADAANPAGASLTEGESVATDLKGGVVTTAQDGTVFAIAASAGRIATVPSGSKKATTTPVSGLSKLAKLTITAVGNKPVAYDAGSNSLVLPDGSMKDLTSAGLTGPVRLQAPGPTADHVLLATASALVSVRLDGSKIDTVSASDKGALGKPAPPVRHGGCEYSAWAGSGDFVRKCDGDDNVLRLNVETLSAAENIEFRTNRKLIVLNDIASGSVWLPDKNMVLAADWDQIDNLLKKESTQEESPQTSTEIADPQRREHNDPPVANPDSFGVRPGRSTTLDVLSNDSDSDGDILTASPATQPTLGPVTRTRGGQALRIDVPASAKGKASFTYQASDGAALAMSTVDVEVSPWSQNRPPAQIRDPGVKLGGSANAEVTYNALPDWRDPDGDPVYLASVKAPEGLEVQFSEQGTLTIRNLGAKTGSAQIEVSVSDGTLSANGHVTVQVQQPGNIRPTANGDFVVARVGEPSLVQPLANDTDPNGDPLTLVGVSGLPKDAVIVQDLDLGTVSFTARAPGTYTFFYTVSDGPTNAVGVIRIDAVQADISAAPVAEDDLALLPPNGAVLAAPLNNDTDPAGGVLVLQSVNVSPTSPLKVTLVDHHLLRITSQVPLTDPVELGYTVSNGNAAAQGRVFVVPTHSQEERLAPQTQPDAGKVRVGDVGSVNVLANDRSPTGLALTLDSHLDQATNPAAGKPFITGSQVRLEAGTTPGYTRIAYSVRDSSGAVASSTVTFEVVANDGPNSAPRPKTLTAWALAGQTIRIPVPLAGIDPDGDSVTLAGTDQPPAKGVARLGTDWLEYTPANDMSGTDVFSYVVEDRLGKQAVAIVRVGIAPPSAINQPPAAVPDTLLVRPDRQLSVPVAANDIDPDGDSLTVVPDGLVATTPGLTPRVDNNRVVVTTPSSAGSSLVTYKVSDNRGGVDVGSLTINVSPDAPLQVPIARDDVVADESVPVDGKPVAVDVLANDEDPGGDAGRLKLTSAAPGVTVKDSKLEITPDKARRLVVYSITNQDGLTASAVVSVPGTERTRPKLDETKIPVKIRSGQEFTLNLNDYVITREGRTPRILDPSTVRGSVGSDGNPKVTDDHTIVFKAGESYFGDTAVSFQVSDGTNEDRSALSATLSIPIKVEQSVNHPPKVTPTTMRIGPGEDPVTFDLAQMVQDPDGRDPATFAYTMTGFPDKLTVSVENNHVLTVSAAVDHPKGPAGEITIGVNDGSGVVLAAIPVVVTASSKPLVQTSAVHKDMNAGQSTSVNLADVTTNPFPTPLRIVSTTVTTLAGVPLATVSPSGTTLTITPNANTHGEITVTYVVQDATGDASRHVSGTVAVTVRDVPDAPANVMVSPSSKTAALTFSITGNNGAEITSYLITDVVSGQTWTVPASSPSSATIHDLANGFDRSFTVQAINVVGASKASPASAKVLIDQVPDRPSPPTMTVADGTATVTWSAPANDGSPISAYVLTLQGAGAPAPVTVRGKDPMPYTFTQLTNGQPYAATVSASNLLGTSETSTPSSAVRPFGPPPAPTSLSVLHEPPPNSSKSQVTLSWTLDPNTNGREYAALEISSAGVILATVEPLGKTTSKTVQVDAADTATLSARVRNTENQWSTSTTVTFQAASIPMPLDAPTLSVTGVSGQVTVSSLSTVPGNGFSPGQLSIQYSTDGSNFVPFDTSASKISGLVNGRSYTLSFRQIGVVDGQKVAGPSVDSTNSVTPYGPPTAPKLTTTASAAGVTISWDATGSGNGRDVTSTRVFVNGESVSTAISGQVIRTGTSGEAIKATAQACYLGLACDANPSSTATGYIYGTVNLNWVSNCNGTEVPGMLPALCHTFKVQALNWGAGVPSVTCTYKDDTSAAHTLTVPTTTRTNSWTDSKFSTAAGDQATIDAWLTGSNPRFSCSPQ